MNPESSSAENRHCPSVGAGEGCRVRQAAEVDLEAIGRIQAASPTAARWRPKDYLGHLCLVAEESGGIAGFIVAREAAGEYEILNLAVAPDRRRRGVGRQLLSALLGRVSGPVFPEVRASNRAARRLYESCGFHPVGIRENYYRDPTESAIVMRFQSC